MLTFSCSSIIYTFYVDHLIVIHPYVAASTAIEPNLNVDLIIFVVFVQIFIVAFAVIVVAVLWDVGVTITAAVVAPAIIIDVFKSAILIDALAIISIADVEYVSLFCYVYLGFYEIL